MPTVDPAFEALLEYLKRNRGFDFTGYKRSTLMRRVHKRMEQVNLSSFSAYLDYLEVHPDEFAPLFNTILINVTGFFRDTDTWDFISSQVVPRVLASKNPGEPIRAWSAGCASGEEAFSLAIVLANALGMEEFRQRVKIYATDVDEEALQAARHATFTSKQLERVTPDQLRQYFDETNGRYVLQKDMRRAVIFGRHDLIQDAPISRVDLLVCRNTLMYFNAETQARIAARFHFALNPGGFLILGRAEMLLAHGNTFVPYALRHRVFTRINRERGAEGLPLLDHSNDDSSMRSILDHVRLRDAAFDSNQMAQIIIDAEGALALVNERARTMFGLTARDLGRAFSDLEVSYRPAELRSQIDLARTERRTVQLREIPWSTSGGEPHFLDITVVPMLDHDGAVLGASLAFSDVTTFKQLQYELRQANEELETAYEELQSTNEELETTNEELQSTIEELETTNEELQSTNEELETMNEELQSTNEELHTINDQLTQRSDELNQVNKYLSAVLEGVPSGVIVLDRELCVQAWNRTTEQIWGVRFEDVRGKHVQTLSVSLAQEPLLDAIRSCQATGTPSVAAVNGPDRWGREVHARITCSPMQLVDGTSDGVLLVMNTADEPQER